MTGFPKKELLYEFGKEITYIKINKEIKCNISIIDTNKTLLYKNNNTLFEKDHYYFFDIKGICKKKYARIIVKLFTYLDNVIQEEFVLGVNSSFNIIKIHKEYNNFKIYLFAMGEVEINIDNIKVIEVNDTKKIDIKENIVIKSDLLEDLLKAFNLFTRNYNNISKDQLIANGLNDIWYEVKGYEEIKVLDLSSWSSDKPRNYLLSLNAYSNCIIYCDLIKEIDDEKTSDKIIDNYYKTIEFFIDNYEYTSQFNGLTYNDMTVAKRVFAWIYFYAHFHDKLSDTKKNKLLSFIIYEANLLMEDHFNTRGTNHGLYQDIAAFTYLYCFQNKYSNYKLEDIAKNICEYFNFAITDEGVLKEHSPVYQALILENMKVIFNVFKKIGFDVKDMQDKINKMVDYCVNIMMPNQLLPRIGDGTEGRLSWASSLEKFVDLDKVKPKENIVYPESGYAVFRKDIDKKEKSTYVLFYNAYNSFYHKHSDENGLIIYRDGEIITEAGANGYQYDDPYTKYAYSSWAHNTLIVNDKGLVEEKNIPNDYNYNGTYIDKYDINNPLNVSITGVTERYKNVKFERNVLYKKKKDMIIVKDIVSSNVDNKYTILWNLAVDLDVKMINNNKLEVYRNDKRVMAIVIKSSSKYDISLIKGQKEPRLLGWMVKQGSDPIPTYVIKIDFYCNKKIKLITRFLLD